MTVDRYRCWPQRPSHTRRGCSIRWRNWRTQPCRIPHPRCGALDHESRPTESSRVIQKNRFQMKRSCIMGHYTNYILTTGLIWHGTTHEHILDNSWPRLIVLWVTGRTHRNMTCALVHRLVPVTPSIGHCGSLKIMITTVSSFVS